jgi:hypothetical protein
MTFSVKGLKLNDVTLRRQMVEECVAMAKHAYAGGKIIPGDLVETLEYYTSEAFLPASETGNGKTATMPPIIPDPGEKTGERVPGIAELNAIHERLTRIVDPAKPGTILLLAREDQKNSRLSFLGAVPFVRRMMLASLICLVLFIGVSLFKQVGGPPESWVLFNSSGLDLLLKELFLLCAAGMGASFTALFRANRHIVRGTFDPKYESTYWIRFTLGIIAGMILATLIPIGETAEAAKGAVQGAGEGAGEAVKETVAAAGEAVKNGAEFVKEAVKNGAGTVAAKLKDTASTGPVVGFEKPLLAMLGGFSTDVVYQILERLVAAVGTMVRGDTSKQMEAREQELKARAIEDNTRTKFQLASDLMKVQDQLASGAASADVKKQIGALLGKLTDTGEEKPLMGKE